MNLSICNPLWAYERIITCVVRLVELGNKKQRVQAVIAEINEAVTDYEQMYKRRSMYEILKKELIAPYCLVEDKVHRLKHD